MKRLHSILNTLVELSFSDKKKLLFIISLYIRVSFLLKFVPLQDYFYRFFKLKNDHLVNIKLYTKDISLIKKVLSNLPFNVSCLKESIIVHLYFERKGIQIPLYLGVDSKHNFRAHAWYDDSNSNGFNQLNI